MNLSCLKTTLEGEIDPSRRMKLIEDALCPPEPHTSRTALRTWPEQNYINWNVIDIEGIAAIDHSNRAGLQLADCVASAFSAALELNAYSMTTPGYALSLKPIVFERDKSERDILGMG